LPTPIFVVISLKKSRRLRKAVIILLLLAGFLLTPAGASIRSYAVMVPYSWIHYGNSVLKRNNIRFDIPGGIRTKKADWYPFVLTFNDDDGLSWFLEEEVEFTVLYNFGHYLIRQGTSSYYSPDSPYYSSFYGGYIVKPKSEARKFGFLENGAVDSTALARVPEYDQKYLVLSSLGCPPEKRVFSQNIVSEQYDVDYAGYQGWVRLDSEIETNSPAHESKEFMRGYLQYGRPLGRLDHDEDFPVINLKGRAYIRYFDELKATVVLFIMAPAWTTVNECDEEILSNTFILYEE
jgi:hypothetical protein